MRVLRAKPPTADAHRSFVQIKVVPFKPESSTLPESERESDSPACAITALAGDPQQALNLFDAVRLDFLFREFRRLRDQRWILHEVTALPR